jgi:hypothetical protein
MDLARTQKLYDWIREHPLINLNGLCKECDVDRGNFVRRMDEGKGLKNVLVDKFEASLSKYGYGYQPKLAPDVEKKPNTATKPSQPPMPPKEPQKPDSPYEAFTQRIDKCESRYELSEIGSEVNKEKSFSSFGRITLHGYIKKRMRSLG